MLSSRYGLIPKHRFSFEFIRNQIKNIQTSTPQSIPLHDLVEPCVLSYFQNE